MAKAKSTPEAKSGATEVWRAIYDAHNDAYEALWRAESICTVISRTEDGLGEHPRNAALVAAELITKAQAHINALFDAAQALRPEVAA